MVPPSKIGASSAAPMFQKPVPGPNSCPIASALLPAFALRVMLGRRLARRNPDLRAGRVQIGLGLEHVGPLLDERRGQAERQVAREASGLPA